MHRFKLILYLTLILLGPKLFGQNSSIDSCNCDFEKDIIFGGPEKMATFPGGYEELLKFVSDNLIYPEEAKNKSYVDTVYVRFCIYKNGEIKETEVLKGKYEILNNEALRIVKIMPNWEPAKNRGKPICSSFALPFKFIPDKEEPNRKKIKERNKKNEFKK
jgi:TonB family protein